MAVDAPPPSKAERHFPSTEEFIEVQQSAEFGELRRAHRSFAFPLTLGFITWYLLYVLLSNYAGGFMGTKLVGHINVAFVLGIAQFVTTFLIAWLYGRYMERNVDPLARGLEQRYVDEAGGHGGGVHR